MLERLHPDDLRQLAKLIADELIAAQDAPVQPQKYVTVKTLAEALGVSTAFVYDHAAELGGVKLTDKPKAPWRFDLERARQVIDERAPQKVWQPLPRRRRMPTRSGSGAPLLPVREPRPKAGSILKIRG